MTDKRSDERKRLVALADGLFDDIFETSDEEILREVATAGGEPAAVSARMRSQFEENLMTIRKERMKAAKSGRAAKSRTMAPGNDVDISRVREAVRIAFQQDGLSMAARNETESELTDEEVLRKYHDLLHLGVIDPDDEISS